MKTFSDEEDEQSHANVEPADAVEDNNVFDGTKKVVRKR